MANSGGEAIALDTDAQAQLAAQWEEYADAVEASGQPPVQPEALREQLGAIYEPFVQSKAGENLARQQAYQRVAAEARLPPAFCRPDSCARCGRPPPARARPPPAAAGAHPT